MGDGDDLNFVEDNGVKGFIVLVEERERDRESLGVKKVAIF